MCTVADAAKRGNESNRVVDLTPPSTPSLPLLPLPPLNHANTLVEFIAHLLKIANDAAENELVSTETILTSH
ncbi:hypothetical protein I3843_10G094200 [Carya illinoinensis]|nr:hypothetical protein I3843_10G094200 [Carya illinoinensis]